MIVQCATCAHFTPNEHTPSHGIGSCALGSWSQSKSPVARNGSYHPPAPFAQADRICAKWVKG